jgi:hypothetical protein
LPAPEYSAFGARYPVYDPGGDRIRWFCPWYIGELDTLENALNTVADLDGRVSATRITVRLISKGNLSPCLVEALTRRGFHTEASMATTDGRVITYVACCHPQRRSSSTDVRSASAMLASIMARARKGHVAIAQEFRQLGDFRVEMVGPDTLSEVDSARLVELHRTTFPTFPYDFENKLALMVSAPDNYLMCQVRSKKNNQIYAFSNLEFNTVVLDDGSTLRLAEYDNSMRVVTCPDHGAVQGLGAIIRLELARQASGRNVDLCHAESRAGLAAINGISHHLGMHFGGTLENHLLISGHSDVRRQAPSKFESMHVWYLNRAQLAALNP